MKNELYHYGVKGMKWGVRNDRINHSFHMKKKKVMLWDTEATHYSWFDEAGKRVAEFKVWDWWDGKNVSDLEIDASYRGQRLSYELLDYATKRLGVRNLAVRKDNTIARHVYDKYGFKVTDQDDDMLYMSLKKWRMDD